MSAHVQKYHLNGSIESNSAKRPEHIATESAGSSASDAQGQRILRKRVTWRHSSGDGHLSDVQFLFANLPARHKIESLGSRILATIMSPKELQELPASKSNIDWAKIKQGLPKTAGPQVEAIQEAYESGSEPARAVEIALRERLAALRIRFQELKGAPK
jgi:hypothetical protein